MSQYANDLLTDLFNQFEENNEGIFFFTGAEDGPVTPVDNVCQELLEETAKFLMNVDEESLDNEDD